MEQEINPNLPLYMKKPESVEKQKPPTKAGTIFSFVELERLNEEIERRRKMPIFGMGGADFLRKAETPEERLIDIPEGIEIVGGDNLKQVLSKALET